MNVSAELVALIDPDGTIPGLNFLFESAPENMTASLLELAQSLSPREMALVHRSASGETLTSSGRHLAEVVGQIHLVAVLAPLMDAFYSSPYMIIDSDLSKVVYSVHQICSVAWHCDASGFRLDQKNRFFYVRGMFLYYMKSAREGLNNSVIDPMFDQHLMWVGSRFEDLKPRIHELLIGNEFSREFIEAIATRSAQDLSTTTGVSAQTQSEGYYKNGYFSVIPEDGIAEFDTGEVVSLHGLDVPVLHYVYMVYQENCGFDFNAVVAGLDRLVRGLDTEAEDNGRLALALMCLNSDLLQVMTKTWSRYSEVDRDVLVDNLDLRFARHDASRDAFSLSDDALTATIVMPVLRAFSSTATDRFTSDQRNAHILDLSDQFLSIWSEYGDDRVNDSAFEQYVARCRALAMHFVVNNGSVPEHDAELEQLGGLMDVVCRNADVLLQSKDLSITAVSALS